MFLRRFFLVLFSTATIFSFAAVDPKLHVCTVANYTCPNLDNLINSGRHFGIEVEVVGMDQPYRNHFYKLTRMLAHLNTLPKNDIVLFVDGFDVLLLAPPEKILTTFAQKHVPCIFSAERRYYPNNSVADLKIEYPPSDTSFRYLNSGSYIGHVSFLILMIEEIISDHYSIPWKKISRINDDQFHCHRYFIQNQNLVYLDRTNEFFLALAYVDKSELKISKEDKSVFVKETGNFPMVIHGNGPGRPLYEEFARTFF